jgi:aspartate aminotransferase
MMSFIGSLEENSVFMFHACAHNPTGCDLNPDQWRQVSCLLKEKKAVILLDSAYQVRFLNSISRFLFSFWFLDSFLCSSSCFAIPSPFPQGFASGDPEKDAFAIRTLVKDGHQIMLCQSYAKNFGLYGERVGLFSVVTESKEEADRVLSQLKIIVRPMYSSPPIHGARIVAEILSDPSLKSQWLKECKTMADRIQEMRVLLRSKLEEGQQGKKNLSRSYSWNHVTDQIGMFCYTGLTKEQVSLPLLTSLMCDFCCLPSCFSSFLVCVCRLQD